MTTAFGGDKEKMRKYSADRYKNDPEFKAQTNKRTQERRDIGRQLVNEYKLLMGCYRCGYKRCASALHLHHRDPELKEAPVSTLLTAAPERLLAEIDKCLVMCANCHFEYHFCGEE